MTRRPPSFGPPPSRRFWWATAAVCVAAFLFGMLWPYVLVHT